MKRLIQITLLILIPVFVVAQTVSTLVGSNGMVNDAILYLDNGVLIGTDYEGAGVYKIDMSGGVTTFCNSLNRPNGIEKDAVGNFYVASPQEDEIYKITPDGVETQYGPSVTNPNNIIFQRGTDTLIEASYIHHKVYKLATDGTVVDWFVGGQLLGPLSMTYDDADNFYISNFTDGKIFRVEGDSLVHFASVPWAVVSGLQAGVGFIKFINGYIYATGFGTNKIYRVDMSGQVSVFAGNGIAGTFNGTLTSSRFYWPNGLASNPAGDTLFISEYYTHTVRMITGLPTSINEEDNVVLDNFKLFQNYPNPFNPNTTIPFTLHKKANVKIEILNILGQKIMTLTDDEYVAGSYSVKLNGNQLAAGLYFYEMQIRDGNNMFTDSRRMLLLK